MKKKCLVPSAECLVPSAQCLVPDAEVGRDALLRVRSEIGRDALVGQPDACGAGESLRVRNEVVNRQESYQQPPARSAKKAEGKKRKSPCTPFREKGKVKEKQTGFPKETVLRAGARVRAALDADLDAATRAFGGTAEDRRIWAAVAWRVGVEEFHFALMDKLAEDAADNAVRRPAAAFQAFLNARFPKGGAA